MESGETTPSGRRTAQLDPYLFAATVGLLVIGIVSVFSASYTTALNEFGDPLFIVKRQLLWAAIGLACMIFVLRIDYRIYRPLALPGLLTAVILLILVLLIGTEVGGGQRWIQLGVFSFQPSELAKLALINFLAAYVAYQRGGMSRFASGLVWPMLPVGLVCGLIVLEPDFGTALAVLGTSLIMLFAGGSRFSHLAAAGAAGVPVVAVLIWTQPYRLRRITSFLDPWSDPLDSGWNVIQSLLAIGSGGLLGLGLGAGRQKFAYLPEQHTDFIFAILGEELGFLGTGFVLLLFSVIAWRGLRAALWAPDLYGSMLGVGITSWIVLQAMLNIGVVTGSLPVTGITLPLISFGGSSLVVTLIGIGILMNIAKLGRADA